jgi:hypothetical protein
MKKFVLPALAAAMLSTSFAAPAFASTTHAKVPQTITNATTQLVSAQLPHAKNSTQDYRKMLQHAGVAYVAIVIRVKADRPSGTVKETNFDH